MKRAARIEQPELPELDIQLSHPAVDHTNLKKISQDVLEAAWIACKNNGWKTQAAALDDTFGPDRSVSESLLRQALKNNDRNYARLEWAPLIVSLPGCEVLQILAEYAGYEITKKRKLTDTEWRAKAERVLAASGAVGQHVLEEIER
jgi:hypothetical protein